MIRSHSAFCSHERQDLLGRSMRGLREQSGRQEWLLGLFCGVVQSWGSQRQASHFPVASASWGLSVAHGLTIEQMTLACSPSRLLCAGQHLLSHGFWMWSSSVVSHQHMFQGCHDRELIGQMHEDRLWV